METASKSHELFPIDISFVRTDKKSEEFEEELDKNPILANSFENQFIIGTRYSYTVNTQLSEIIRYKDLKKENTEPIISISMEMLTWPGILFISYTNRFGNPGEGQPELMNAPYSPYIKGDIDLRHYWQFDPRNKLASRIIIGAGYAYVDRQRFHTLNNIPLAAPIVSEPSRRDLLGQELIMLGRKIPRRRNLLINGDI